MKVTDFGEIVTVMMKRKRIALKDVACHIGTSSVYARQVIDGMQRGNKAEFYRIQIAEYLDIDSKYLETRQGA